MFFRLEGIGELGEPSVSTESIRIGRLTKSDETWREFIMVNKGEMRMRRILIAFAWISLEESFQLRGGTRWKVP